MSLPQTPRLVSDLEVRKPHVVARGVMGLHRLDGRVLRRRTWPILSLILGFGLGCSTVVRVPRMKPAEVNLAGYPRLAVGELRGAGGSALAADLTQGLLESQRFEVLDRHHLDTLMAEQRLSASGAVSDETAISVGHLKGSAALLVGDVFKHAYTEVVESREVACEDDDDDGAPRPPCRAYTRRATAEVDVALKVIDTATGRVLAVKSLRAEKRDQAQASGQPPSPLRAADRLLKAGRRQVVDNFMKVIAPYRVYVSVTLLEDSALPELEAGNQWAQDGDWPRAQQRYAAAVQRAQTENLDAETQAKAHHNLGVALGYSGDYDRGIAELERAYALDSDSDFRRQMQVLRGFQADDARLAQQRTP